jgi:hypothetical protein
MPFPGVSPAPTETTAFPHLQQCGDDESTRNPSPGGTRSGSITHYATVIPVPRCNRRRLSHQHPLASRRLHAR